MPVNVKNGLKKENVPKTKIGWQNNAVFLANLVSEALNENTIFSELKRTILKVYDVKSFAGLSSAKL